MSGPRYPEWLMLALLVLATILSYQPVWHAGFIWDDDYYITNNLTLRSLDGLRQIWCNLIATPQYYPLGHTSFWLEYHLWGLDPLGYHVVNVLLHALAAILLWRVLARLQLPGAWLTAAIFALHPVTVESVAWVTERKNVLAAVFYFASALAYLRWTGASMEGSKHIRGSRRWYILALALFIAALLSKTVACSLPAAILLLIWWKRGGIAGRDVWPLLPFFAAGVGMGLVTSWLERTHVGAQGSDWAFNFPERCLIAGRAVWFYAGKLLWPENLTFIYPRWHIDTGVWWQWNYPVAALAVVVALWCLRRRIGCGPLVAVLFFGGTLLPALGFTNVYPMRYTFVADHYQYLASVGLLALAGVGITMAFGCLGKRSPLLKPLLCGALLLALGGLTWRQCRMYADVEMLWQTTIDRNPGCLMAHINLGNILFQKGRIKEEIVQLKQALVIKPDNVEAHYNLGIALLLEQQLDGAIVQFQSALAIQPDNVNVLNNLGTAFAQKGQLEEAIVQFQRALVIESDNAGAHYNLGNALFLKGQVSEAIIQYQRALAIQPDYPLADNNLGTALLQIGRADEAIMHLRRALVIQHDNVEALNNLGTALVQQKQLDQALVCFQKALVIRPGFVEAQNSLANFAWMLATSSNPSVRNGAKAVELALQADRLSGGRNPRMAATLAAAYAESGRFPEAITIARRGLELAAEQKNDALAAVLQREMQLYETHVPLRDVKP